MPSLCRGSTRGERWWRWFPAAVAAAIWLGGSTSAAATTCAVIPASKSAAETSTAELLEQQLGATGHFKLVTRTELDAVLREQLVSAAPGAQGVRSRVELGKLVKADLLVFLRERQGKGKQSKQSIVELTAAETRRGLRMVVEPALWNPGGLEPMLGRFAAAVRRAVDLSARNDLKVFAVPPFECKDFSITYTTERQALAQLTEEFLTALPNVVTVELAEAEALASGKTATRRGRS